MEQGKFAFAFGIEKPGCESRRKPGHPKPVYCLLIFMGTTAPSRQHGELVQRNSRVTRVGLKELSVVEEVAPLSRGSENGPRQLIS